MSILVKIASSVNSEPKDSLSGSMGSGAIIGAGLGGGLGAFGASKYNKAISTVNNIAGNYADDLNTGKPRTLVSNMARRMGYLGVDKGALSSYIDGFKASKGKVALKAAVPGLLVGGGLGAAGYGIRRIMD